MSEPKYIPPEEQYGYTGFPAIDPADPLPNILAVVDKTEELLHHVALNKRMNRNKVEDAWREMVYLSISISNAIKEK